VLAIAPCFNYFFGIFFFFFFFFPQVTGLKTQVSSCKNLVRAFRKELGDAEAKTLLGKAVYLINIGSNDYAVFTTNSSVLQPISQEEYVNLGISNVTIVIKVIKISAI
jgi:hypothetical protein